MGSAPCMSKDTESWTVEDVGDFIEHVVGLPQLREMFEGEEITGLDLLELTGDELKEMGISVLGQRKKILAALASLQG